MAELLLFADQFLSGGLFDIIIKFLAIGGWLVFAYMLLYAGLFLAAWYKAGVYSKDWDWTLLAIDVPQENVQTPKAVEQLFTHIFSIMEPPDMQKLYRRGFVQFTYSFEIISIEGYIQFLIRTLTEYRDVVEAAVYAQYPEAEITEVQDYVNSVPHRYPNETHNCWAAEYYLTQHFSQPIRLYTEFEHSIAKDTVLKDPMGTFLESFSRIGPGEQMWYQIIIEPLEEKRWKNDVIKKVKELIGEKAKSKTTAADLISNASLKTIETVGDQIFGREASAASKEEDRGEQNRILYMTPGEKDLVESMEKKLSKIGYKTKIRLIYVAEKEVYNPARGINSVTGAMNQFNNPGSNGILPKYLTSTRYLWASQRKDYRRNVMMNAYKNRSLYSGGRDPYILNIEELATIWHFPMSHVQTPLIQKAAGKRAEPPIGLPVDLPVGSAPTESTPKESSDSSRKPLYYTDSGQPVYDNDAPQLG